MIEKALFIIQEEDEEAEGSSDGLDREFGGLNEEGLMEPKVGSGRDSRIEDTMDYSPLIPLLLQVANTMNNRVVGMQSTGTPTVATS